ncbi:RING-H2 finger protein ATL74-like [Punica granatum]|uniref:RING-type E3 ubiquitin transferase n=2 Tax=Punica granatum TaxID=22663 RepID=A0A218XRQ3_PUNGR|nr:RING-H2 finger protein ATL74-like [Punica granatum]XP_031375009.1 RING-H2 finger protein ATL74-like [Punica granatum]XP_031375010.1 RING-H2 finger protein ATL74-like [Punica granatum]OWM87346.1 hypothetical protein CDL15_Pgr022457 [Punica granatum]PKI46183.1 hypothetical protein CRG98_033441 [Punica granatum]
MATLPFAHRPHRLLLDTGSNPPPEVHGDRPRGHYGNEASFDSNMVIILAALLCALICALGLNSIVRCALRCSRRFSLETSDRATARMTATGLKKSALRRIPVSVHRTGLGIPAAATATDCPICLGEFEDGEKVRVLPRCHHRFHIGCIDTWLVSHSSCPTCRQSVLEHAPPPIVSDATVNPLTEIPVTAESELG